MRPRSRPTTVATHTFHKSTLLVYFVASLLLVGIAYFTFHEAHNDDYQQQRLSPRRAKYSGVPVSSADHVFTLDRHFARRRRRSASLVASRARLHGIARDCGHACRVRLRSGDTVYVVHMHRWSQITSEHNGTKKEMPNSMYVPIVMYLESDEKVSGRVSRASADCIYKAMVDGAAEHSIVNLCDSNDGLYGMLALPDGIYTVEPLSEQSSNSRHRHHMVRPFESHTFKAFDEPTENRTVEDEGPKSYTDKWEDIIERKARSRRSANSWDHFVEVLVVADTKMYEYHGHALEDYILTLFSTVASIYRHQSLRASINVVVVKIIILKTPESGPAITPNAQQTLQDFCRWQSYYNSPSDVSTQHYDVAILLTRGDICRSRDKCDTLGLAELGTMCDMTKSCAIIEDNGLSAAFTIAHELGHVFGIPHDDEKKCSNYMELNKSNFHIMAPTLEYNTHPWSWSRCSAGILERFLENRGKIQCLFDQPVERKYYDDMFGRVEPGRKYDVHQQCKFVFGPQSELCPYMPTCRRLWCATYYGSQMGCRTQHMPWADGTRCDEARNMYCHRGECVHMQPESRHKVDGNWGEWQHWQQCSRTCGGGVQKALRDCDSPTPLNGGKYCVGQREKYRSCNTQECAWDTPGFREVQCAAFNGKDVGIHGVPIKDTNWVPKYAGVAENERCKLYCRASGSSGFYLLKDQVIDGTPCDRNGDDICIAGTCTAAGCDHTLSSDIRRDKCGICGGDNSSCHVVTGTYNEVGAYGYNAVMKIPAGSANIDIRQNGYMGQKGDDTYLSLAYPNGEFILNGYYQVSRQPTFVHVSVFRQTVPVQDVVLEYSGSDVVVERINGTGPIRSDIYVHILSVGEKPPNITYEYMTFNRPADNKSFYWRPSHQWGDCNKICQGQQYQQMICYDATANRQTHEKNCPANRTMPKSRHCNTGCTVKWHTEDSSSCSARCGVGQKRQRVTCVKMEAGHTQPINEGHCDRNKKPNEVVTCTSDCSGRRWKYSAWTTCSESCGTTGVMARSATCVDQYDRPINGCGRKDETERECNRVPCPRWHYGHWSECSRSCDGGVRMRHAQCLDATDRETHQHLCGKKHTHEACNQHACTWWTFGPWSDCNVSCGDGVQYRQANCTDRSLSVLSEGRCNKNEKIVTKACHKKPCPSYKLGEWSQCSVSCEDGWSLRKVACVDGNGREVDLERCGLPQDKPPTHKTCNNGACPFWRTGDWKACSVSCGYGVRERQVDCVHRNQVVDASYCGDARQPEKTSSCSLAPCTNWDMSPWTPCSVSCGTGYQTRTVRCVRGADATKVDEFYCNKKTKPRTEKTCERDMCTQRASVFVAPQQDVPPIRWATGPWTKCSTTCGPGVQRRLIKCRDHVRELPDKYCQHLEKVPHEQKCESRPCSYWKTEAWRPCPATCGTHVEQLRKVACISAETRKELPDTDCDIQTRPESAKHCRLEPCPKGEPPLGNWVIGNWSECSVSCGGGWRRRTIDCDGILCDDLKKPRLFDRCAEQNCPPITNNSWQITPWTHCSVTCGMGVQKRSVWCEDSLTGKKQPDTECVERRPLPQKDCEMPPCAALEAAVLREKERTNKLKNTTLWQASGWSACSAPCGRGSRTRTVLCVDTVANSTVASTLCNSTTKPAEEIRCRISVCPRWRGLAWGSCSVTCGEGVRERQVFCQRGRRQRVSDDQCAKIPKPQVQARCFPAACPAFKWTVTPWSKCKDACANGERQHRRVFCMNNNGKRAAPRMCEPAKAPPTSRICDVTKCPYEWVPGEWNTCSKSCGNGTQLREVECRLKTPEGSKTGQSVLLPREKCELFPRPKESQPCLLNQCEAEFIWVSGPWQECSKTCGQGVRRRKVRCQDRNGKRVVRTKCEAITVRPRRTQACFERNCLPSTCQEVRAMTDATKDGNYTVLLDGFPITVYCDRMNQTIPRAYLNLNPETNYAEVFGKKLIYPHTCPHNGERNESCLCTDDGAANAGLTAFSKVRVDLLHHKIHLTDYKFADKKHGQLVPYATAGDCYSMHDCPQGIFSLDLRGTGLKIVNDLKWEGQGHRSAVSLERTHNNAKIEGRCGGYCGKCVPERYKGLIFETDPQQAKRDILSTSLAKLL